ncbi:MAG: hypothetical protein ABFC18_03240 [Rikenellaceae bacterium]
MRTIGEILEKHNLTVDLVHNKAMTERVYAVMEEYAALKFAEYLTTDDKDIEEWAKEQFMPNKDYSHLTTIQAAILIAFKGGCSYGAKAMRDGLIKSKK